MDRALLKSNAKNQFGGGIFQSLWLNALLAVVVYSLIVSAASATVIGSLIVMGPLTYGITKIFLQLVYGSGKIDIGMLFDGFRDDFAGTFLIGFMSGLFVMLWSLLFIIPGIIKAYAYAMAYYIKVDHPDYDWRQCLKGSEEMMRGHKFDLFVLELSFIGWMIVGTLACGIGTLWVMPYMECTTANFYACLCANSAPQGGEFTQDPFDVPGAPE